MNPKIKILAMLILVLIGWGFFLYFGSIHSKSAWPQNSERFDLGWIFVEVAVVATVILLAPLGNRIPNAWRWVFLPAIGCALLESAAVLALRQFVAEPNRATLFAFSILSCLFLIAVLFWIAPIPFEEKLGISTGKNHHVLWKTSWLAIAAAVSLATLYQVLHLFLSFAPTPGLQQLHEIESLLQWFAIVTFVYLSLRVFLPLIVLLTALLMGKTIRVAGTQMVH